MDCGIPGCYVPESHALKHPLGELSDSKLRRAFVWQYPAEVDRVIDGDSVEMHVAFGPENEQHGLRVRIDGINAIELSQKFGSEAKAYLAGLLPAGLDVTLVVRKREKYGRLLARIILPDGRDVSQEMLVAKASDEVTPLAVPYNP